MKLLIILLFFLPFSSSAKWNVAFIGISGENAPSLEKGYESLLRERLSMEAVFFTKDYHECQKFRRAIRFDDYTSVSRNYLDNLVRFADDSTLVVWGTVKNFQLNYQQKKLIFTGIKGELLIGLYIYSLNKRDFLFIGDISADVYKSKGIGFLNSKQPISAKDRAELISMLQREAAANSCRTIFEAIRVKNAERQNADSLGEVNEPSIPDVFTTPSGAEMAQIESTTPQEKIDTLKTEKDLVK